jgi:hypothetical protein
MFARPTKFLCEVPRRALQQVDMSAYTDSRSERLNSRWSTVDSFLSNQLRAAAHPRLGPGGAHGAMLARRPGAAVHAQGSDNALPAARSALAL